MNEHNLPNGLDVLYHDTIDMMAIRDAETNEGLLVATITNVNSGLLFDTVYNIKEEDKDKPGFLKWNNIIGCWRADRVFDAPEDQETRKYHLTLDFSYLLKEPPCCHWFTLPKYYEAKIEIAINIDANDNQHLDGHRLLSTVAESQWFEEYLKARRTHLENKNKK